MLCKITIPHLHITLSDDSNEQSPAIAIEWDRKSKEPRLQYGYKTLRVGEQFSTFRPGIAKVDRSKTGSIGLSCVFNPHSMQFGAKVISEDRDIPHKKLKRMAGKENSAAIADALFHMHTI